MANDFSAACSIGDLGVVRELLGLDGDRRIDVHAEQEAGFRWACQHGHLGVVRELLGLDGDRRIDVHTREEAGFRAACRRGRLGVVRELLGLDGDRRIDVHAEQEAGFRWACQHGHLGVVRELLGLDGDRRIDVHVRDEEGFQKACEQGHVDVVRELLVLTGNQCIDVHAMKEAGFRWACEQGHVDVVRELLVLTGNQCIDVHAKEEAGFRWACQLGHVNVLRELLALDGDRCMPLSTPLAGPLCRLLAQKLGLGAGHQGRALVGLLQDCVIPQFVLEVAMKQAYAGDEYEWAVSIAQESIRAGSPVAQSMMHHVLLHALQRTPVTHGTGLLTGGACTALDALALCAVLPGAECRHLVGELVGCGAAVPGGGEGRSVGDAFATYYCECVWRGVSVSADEDAKDMDVSAARMRRGGRRGPVLLRAQTRAAQQKQHQMA